MDWLLIEVVVGIVVVCLLVGFACFSGLGEILGE